MSILKMVNERGTNLRRLYDKYDYLTADSKTDRGKLVGASNCITRFTVDEMLAVKKLAHKSRGRMWVEMVLSLTPEDRQRPDSAYMKLAEDFVDIFREFQMLYTVHLDTSIRHIHFMLNTVSVMTGKKYSQSASDLQRLKVKTNDILLAHGFDIIKTGAEQFIDRSDHSDCSDFTYLEIDEPTSTVSDTVVIGHEIDLQRQDIDILPTVHLSYNYGGEEIMNYDITPTAVETPAQLNESTAICQPADPSATRPTLSVNMGTHYRLFQSGAVLREETVDAAHELGETTPAQLNAAANMAIALCGSAHDRGYDVNVTVDAAPTIDIFLGHDVLGTHPDMTIGTDVIVTAEDGD